MGYNEIFNEIIGQLSKDTIINGAMKDNEMPMGFLLTYIKDMYNIPKPQGWKIAEAVLRYFGIENKMYSLQENKSKISKNVVSINESQLRRIVKESIKKVLAEDISNGEKGMLIQAICQKYPRRNEGGWAKEFNEWIPIEAYISHIDGATATADLRIGDIEENGGTTIEEEVPLQSLPISALQSILNAE